jgi:hypothetical protein
MPENRLRQLVGQHVEGRTLGASASRTRTCRPSTWRWIARRAENGRTEPG